MKLLTYTKKKGMMGVTLLVAIILVVMIFIVVGTMIYMMVNFIKKFYNRPPPPDKDSAGLVVPSVPTNSGIITASFSPPVGEAGTDSNSSILVGPEIWITKVEDMEGLLAVSWSLPASYDTLGQLTDGVWDVVIQKTTNFVDWDDIFTNRVDTRDMSIDSTNNAGLLRVDELGSLGFLRGVFYPVSP